MKAQGKNIVVTGGGNGVALKEKLSSLMLFCKDRRSVQQRRTPHVEKCVKKGEINNIKWLILLM
ncbi:MAG: hypothetical protein PHY47_05800 [Lachnospiraceae bacterium]|nr:hypothetical protein [Lachnospiraceae bacterium]